MIHFSLSLIERAMQIIDAKSFHSDIKAGKDVYAAREIINTYNQYNQINENQAHALDSKLRREYSQIEMLQTAIDNFPKISLPYNRFENVEPIIITRLKLDINGIFLSVLTSHGIIGQAKDFIEKID